MSKSFIISVLIKVANQINAKIILGPDNAQGGYILFKNGKKSFFKLNSWEINNMGTSRVIKDKTLTAYFLKKNGFNTTKGFIFNSKNKKNIEKLDFPVVVKPNNGSKSLGLYRVNRKNDLINKIKKSLKYDSCIRIEEEIKGRHFSAGILDSKNYFIYEKKPFSAGIIIGDSGNVFNKKVKDYLVEAFKLFGLRFGSIDFIYHGDDFNNFNNLYIIEINSAPSFKKYALKDKKNYRLVKKLYKDLMLKLSKK